MTRGRRPLLIPTEALKIKISKPVLEAMEARILQFSASWRNSEEPAYGARSKLVEQLIKKWLAGEVDVEL